MAGTSDYTNGKSMKNVMDDFVARFVKAAPTKKTLFRVGKENIFNGQCSRSGRPSTRLGHFADVENSIQQS
ncbi:hypothetical protein C0J52_17706 [Blattella germanica]|nr:hypothetical protein C0J52_17706 [Blattella germanica]